MSAHAAAQAIAPRGTLDARVRVPGSKSITNRALLVAGLAAGESALAGALASDDTRVMRDTLRALGCGVDDAGDPWRVRGVDGRLRRPPGPLFVGNSGTTARFLTAAATLADGPVVIDGNARMRERPIADLARALGALGARLQVKGPGGCPPVEVAGGGLPGGRAEIDASRSSQYVSALLLAAPYAAADVRLVPAGGVVVSRPYVDLTLQVMRSFGAEAGWEHRDDGRRAGNRGGRAAPGGELCVSAARRYAARCYAIEPDASAAVYPFCAAAIAGGRVRVDGIPAGSIQADLGILAILERMGCAVQRGDDSVAVTGPAGPLHGVDVDMNDLPDAVLALAVVALFAEGETRIRNVANLRIKETDRLAALETELRKLGADARASEDGLLVRPGHPPEAGAEIETYDDHRMAMAFALAGLRLPGVVIRDPGCVSKTWPEFFRVLERL